MRLYGDALARQIPEGTTAYTARAMYAAAARALTAAAVAVEAWDMTGWAGTLGLDAGAQDQARQYLASTAELVVGYASQIPLEGDLPLTDEQVEDLRISVSQSSIACRTIDELFGSSYLSELADAIIDAAGTVPAKIANTVAKVAGSAIGELWWVIALVVVVAVGLPILLRGGR